VALPKDKKDKRTPPAPARQPNLQFYSNNGAGFCMIIAAGCSGYILL